MLYKAYEAGRVMSAPTYAIADLGAKIFGGLPAHRVTAPALRIGYALSETTSALRYTHRRPEFRIDEVDTPRGVVRVQEEAVGTTPFGTLRRFAKDGAGAKTEPAVLIVPGLAGHFATLVRGTVRKMLADHDVYVADWHNARDVPVDAGPFGLDEYIAHIIEFLTHIGPGTHVMAVCQPCPSVLAAAAIMAQDGHPAAPASLVLMSGPVDARINPGPINAWTARQSLSGLRKMTTRVPWPYAGAGRHVYPGFLQITGFMSMASRRHVAAFGAMFNDFARGRDADAERAREFYEEYFAVLDIAAEFYLDTARVVFMDHKLAQGKMEWRGRRVEPAAIRSPLLTIEAENDELCPPGQTRAAHELCTGIPARRKRHYLQPGVGHYGVFSGTRFERKIYPRIQRFIASSDRASTVR